MLTSYNESSRVEPSWLVIQPEWYLTNFDESGYLESINQNLHNQISHNSTVAAPWGPDPSHPTKARASASTAPFVAVHLRRHRHHHPPSTTPQFVGELGMEGAATENSVVPVVVVPEAVAVDADPRVEGAAVDDSAAPIETREAAADCDQHIEDVTATPEDGKHGGTEGNFDVTTEEMRSIIEVIAETGKFWHDWSFLKRLLSLQLKQVLAEYSEAQMVSLEDGQQQNSLSGETYPELFSQLNDALLRFEDGPPFTLQRLCEILLDPKGTYTKLSKLALALEKNLLVTSTLTKCTDPCPAAHGPNSEGTAITEDTSAADVEPERLPEHPAAMPNGTEHVGGDGDEEMADAEAEGVPGSSDVEMQEKLDQIASVNSDDANSGAAVTCETVNASDKPSDPQS